eukprot:2197571-Pyramimonas_sp.AAC.1
MFFEASCGDEDDEDEDVDAAAAGGGGELGIAKGGILASGGSWERLGAFGSAWGSPGSAWVPNRCRRGVPQTARFIL